jgi:glutathione S-transferase
MSLNTDNISSDARALVRLQSDHINRTLVPTFYGYLQAQDTDTEIEKGRAFSAALEGLAAIFERAENEQAHKSVLGLWAEDGEIGWADVMVAPWLVRTDIVLRHYKGYQFPPGKRFAAYLERIKNHPVVKKTTSTEDLYLDSYER